jgi:hypothetical protein
LGYPIPSIKLKENIRAMPFDHEEEEADGVKQFIKDRALI